MPTPTPTALTDPPPPVVIPQATTGTLAQALTTQQGFVTGSLQLDAMQPGANAIDPNAIALGTPLGYPGLPSDIAAGIVFLASDESRYMTGTELVIDGGMTAR